LCPIKNVRTTDKYFINKTSCPNAKMLSADGPKYCRTFVVASSTVTREVLRNIVRFTNEPPKIEPNGWVVFSFFFHFLLIGPNVSCPHWQQRNRRRFSIIALPTRPCLRNDNWNHGTSLLTHLGISNYKIISLRFSFYTWASYCSWVFNNNYTTRSTQHRKRADNIAAATFHKPPPPFALVCVCYIKNLVQK